jgi:hypothetical protein
MTTFTRDDLDRANKEWGANCGPGAVAAIMGMTLDEVRPHMGNFERKHYTNPSLMDHVLRSINRPWRKIGTARPSYGLARIQWDGPWTGPGVPMHARYRYTHWIGCHSAGTSIGVFDINAMANGTGWCSLEDWTGSIVPYILQQYPRASGKWWITHGIEVDRSGKKIARTVLTFPGDADLEFHPS